MNYFSVSGASSSADTSGSFYLEKTLSANSSVSLLGGIRRLSVDTGPETGWDNISVSYKQVIASMRTHEFAFALNPFLEIPTGTTKTGAESHARCGIELLAEKGFADLPESLRELRPAAVEGDVAWETKVTGTRATWSVQTLKSSTHLTISIASLALAASARSCAASTRIWISTTINHQRASEYLVAGIVYGTRDRVAEFHF